MVAERFLNALKKAVADTDLAKTKGSYKLTADFKKKAAAANTPKKAPEEEGMIHEGEGEGEGGGDLLLLLLDHDGGLTASSCTS